MLEYIRGEPLSSCWNRFAESEKYQVSERIADIIVHMGDTRFDMIGGFTGDKNYLLGPTVEGSKLFKGRVSSPFLYLLLAADGNGQGKFHSNDCYHIGPYKGTKEYVLACYDNEIYYYTCFPIGYRF